MAAVVFSPRAWLTRAPYEPFLKALATAGFLVHYADYSSLGPVHPFIADYIAEADLIEGKSVLPSSVPLLRQRVLVVQAYREGIHLLGSARQGMTAISRLEFSIAVDSSAYKRHPAI
jgi:hypothetical protein